MNQQPSPPAVELRDVSFAFERPALQVLQHLSLSVKPGEIVSLIGPSGCGKTTILRIVAGLLQPAEGVVLINGEVSSKPAANCGYVPQAYSLFPWLTVRGNIEYGMQFVEASKARIAEASSHLLQVTGLHDFADVYPNTLSGGMKQRVAIARALAVDPAIILLDEPFGALDLQTRTEVQQYFLEMMQCTPKAVLLVTHDLQEAIILSDTIVILDARPSYIRKIIPVELARPRSRDVFGSDYLMKVYGRVSKEILGEFDTNR